MSMERNEEREKNNSWVKKGKGVTGKKGTEKNQSVHLPLQTVSIVGLGKQHFKSDKVLGEP